tara:strand:- start:477 stop:1976 length:1500 start_codon:yes stop_codon:yes gene_type:complete
MTKILGISFETTDTKVVAASLEQLKNSTPCETSIFAGDSYQATSSRAQQELERITKQYQIPVFTIKECCEKQNQKIEKIDVIKSKLSKWVKKNKIDTLTSDLFLSDHLFSHYERSPYYNRMSENAKLSMFLSLCELTTTIFEKKDPDFVFCIEKNYVIKNIVAAICRSRNIKFVVLDHTRIGETYAFFQSFFPKKSEFKVSEEYLIKAKKYIERTSVKLNDGNVSGLLYTGWTENQVGQLNNMTILSSFIRELKYISKRTVKLFMGLRQRSVASIFRPYTANVFYALAYHYLSSIRRMRYAIFGLPYTAKIPLKCDFFYFPLHLRPESSILTLGRGLDDEVALEYVVRKLPKEAYLVVKENPTMIGDRRKKFYRWISRQSSVILVDPLMSSYELIINSKGVIGISGTALLEAAIFGKPTHAFGHPEFRDFLSSYGYDNLDNYFHLSLSNNLDLNNEIYIYIGWALENGIDLTMDTALVNDYKALEQSAKLIAKSLRRFI